MDPLKELSRLCREQEKREDLIDTKMLEARDMDYTLEEIGKAFVPAMTKQGVGQRIERVRRKRKSEQT